MKEQGKKLISLQGSLELKLLKLELGRIKINNSFQYIEMLKKGVIRKYSIVFPIF